MVYSAATSLGLSVLVKPIILDENSYYVKESHLLSKFTRFTPLFDLECIEQGETKKNIERLFRVDAHKDKYITWCQKYTTSKHVGELAAAAMHYGNEHSLSYFYETAAILVGVPKWGSYRRRCASGETRSLGVEQQSAEFVEENAAKRRCLDGENDSIAILKALCFHGEESGDSESEDEGPCVMLRITK